MAAYNEEDVQWLYGRMVDDGVDAGTIDDFKKSLKNDADRDWYFKRAKKMGLEVGDADEFRSWTVPEEEPYSWEDKAMTPGDKVEQRTMTAPAQDEEETPSIAGGAAAVGEAGAAAVNRVAKPKPKPKQQKHGAVSDWRFRAGMRLAGVNPDNPADNRVSRMQAPRTKPLKAAKRDIAKPTTRINEESGRVEQVSTAQEQRRLAAEILQDPNTIVNQMTNNGGSVEQIKAEMPEHYTWLQNRMGENTDDFLDETIMWKSLEPSMEKIFEEETAAREKREGHTEEDDWGIGITSVIPGDPNFSLKVALGIARNELGDMEGTHKRMVDRLLSENPAAQRWLEKRAREILKDNTDLYNYCKENNIQPGQSIGPGLPPLPVVITKPPTLLGSREQAKDELLKMFQGRTIQHLAPKNDWQWGMRSFFGNNMWGSLASAAVGVGSGKYEAQQLNEAAMADYEKERAGWVAQVTTPALTLGADILTGGFEIPGLASKGATMLGERLMVTAGKRALGIVEKETAKRAVLHTGNSALLKMLGTGANFGVYDAMSTSLHGLATDTFDWGDTAEAGLKGGFKGFVFGGVGFLGETATKGLTGWKTVLGEAGTLAGETATFAAMDYFQTGELTPVTIGRAFGMSLAGRASHPAQYAADFMARYTGEKWKYMVKQAPTINKDTRDMLVNSGYKNMAEFLYNSQTARNVWRALRGKKAVDEGWAQNYLDTLKNELDLMKNDPSVDWNTIRKAEYVLNGRIMPEATAVNYTMRYVDGQAYGVTLDSTGHEINRYKLKSQKAIDEWKSAMSQKCDENLLMLANETYKYDVSRAAFFYAVMRAADEYGVTMDEALGYYNRHESSGISHTVAERIDQLYRREMERDRRPELVEKVEEKYGVDIDEVMKTPRELRTSNEENAFRELCERLSGTYNTDLDKSTEELIQDQKEQAHDEGMQAEGEQRAELKERLEDAVRELERLGIDPARIDGMDDAAMARWMEENGMDAEKAVAVQEYMSAKAAFEGIRDRVQDESRKRIEESNRQTDERTNSDTGGIHPVKMKEGGEEGRDAFVIKGKIVVNQDGTIDTARSDKDITVFYPDTGEKKVMTIADVKSGEPTIDPEQTKQDAAQQITEEVAGQAADDMNRTLKFNQDDTFNVLVDGKEVELKVVGVDPESGNPILEDRQGRRAPAIPEMVQQMHDEWREWKRNGGEPAVEDGERGADNDAAPKVEETPAEEQGPAVMPAPGQSEPRDMVDYLYHKSGMSEKSADNAVRNNLRAAEEKVEKSTKERDENTDPDIQKAIDLDKAVEDAKNELAYWHGVQAERMRERAEQQPAKTEEPRQSNGTENQPAEERLRMTAEGIDPDGEYSGFGMSPETVEALDNGSGIVRLVDALAKELGIKVRTFKGSKDAPGYTDPNTGIIWLNTNREDGGFRQTLGHELLHGLKQEAKRQGKPELYTALRDAVLDYVKKQKGDGYEDYYDSMLNRYQNGLYKYGFQQAMDRGASATQANQEGWANRANVDKDYIEEEIVCDAIGDLIDGNTESASRMLEGIKDKKLLQSIKDYFLDLLKRVKASFKRGDNAKPTPEELAIDRVIENFEKMYKDLIKGRREEMRKEEAGAVAEDEGIHSIEQAAAQDGKLFSFKNEDDLQNKLRKYAKTTDGKRLKWNAEKINDVISETADLIRAVHAALNGDPFYNEFAAKDPTIRLDWRDGEEHPVVTWSRNNVEYKYDMSADLLCVNNDGLEEVLSSPKMCDLMVKMFENEIAKNGGKTYTIKTETDKETGEVKEKKEYFAGGFTSEDYINLYNMLRDMGFVVPCRGCFDAAARLKMLPSVSQKFENQVNDIIGERAKDPEAYDEALREEGRQAQIKENERARRKGEKPKRKVGANGFPLAAPTKEDAIRVAVAADNLTEPITYSQLMSAQGQTEMLSDWGSIFRAWQRTGAGRPKDKLMPEPYTGDITSSTYTIIGPADKRTPNFRDKEVNQGTSLRRNSHSELRPYLIVDEIQFMRDAFVRNLCVFKYMKELDDVRLFGQMGVKFNMSFFPAHDKDGVASGLDANGDYTAAEESVGAREFPYVGADGKTHYDGLRGWAEAQKYCNDDVSLSTVIFSMPHMVKVLTDVPTPDDPSGKWGSAIPFHASGATAKQLFLQGLGWARAIDSDHPFEQEAYTDWEKGVTNFEQVQNDRFGKGWVAVGGKKDGKDMYGHKLEFATSGHYYNTELGLHMVRGGLITDEAWPNMKFNKDGTLNKKALKGVEGFIPMEIDYNNKVRELKSKYGYKEAADYYIQFMQEHGIIPRFHFNVPEEAFLRMCEAAHVDPHHPKLGWKGEGNGWSPIDSPAYYSMFCDYGMTKADGTWSPQRPVGVLNERGEREFRMPANTVDIATEAMKRYTERRLAENAKVDNAISNFADMMVEQGKVSRQQADEALAKTTFDERDSRAREAGEEQVRFSLSEESQKVFDTAKRKFGETQDIREAGYVLPDGTMLDFSGRHELDPGSDSSHLAGRRHTDHRAVNQISFVYDENGDEVDTGVSSDMPDFIKRGAIRIDNNAGLINLSTKPTAGQRKVLRQLVAENGGTVDVDFGDGWDTDHHVEYNNAKATRVLGDIDRYFDEGIKPQSNVRFSLADTFYSNAARAVEGVKQEKAKAEQWKAMLTKAGGIKAGEDKWMGLSTWLDEHKGETLTKDEVRQFVAENGIEMREVNYATGLDGQGLFERYVKGSVDNWDDFHWTEWFDFRADGSIEIQGDQDERIEAADLVNKKDDLVDPQNYDLSTNEGRERYIRATEEELTLFAQNQRKDGEEIINSTRLNFTTLGLQNNREIAFVVPGVEPYQEGDEIHFGPENQGRAVMWVRFGETRDADGKRVLVIDEIQSNRHQDAREKGYADKNAIETRQKIDELRAERSRLAIEQLHKLGYAVDAEENGVYDADAVDAAWDGELEGADADVMQRIKDITKEARELFDKMTGEVPAAPFEKNWHEVAMKRMLRLAAEEGFDKVAWTTGEQQAERYGLGGIIDSIYIAKSRRDNSKYAITVFDKNADVINSVSKDYTPQELADTFGKDMAQRLINGEAEQSSGNERHLQYHIEGVDLEVGRDGMNAFYDKMLPQFMNKYGKKWGVKTGEVTLATPGGETMHSVDVNEDMKRSVMQGQPLFSLSLGAPYQGSKGQIATSVVDRLPKGKRFVDLFSGGGAMTHAAMLSGKYEGYRMNDINPAGQDLFLGGMRGDYRDYTPRDMTDEEFKAIKGTPEGLMLSYGGLGRNIDNDAPTRDRRIRRVQRLEALKPYADKVEASNTDYREVQLQPGDVVYADIPYDGTNKTGYREGAKFDKQAFSEWGLEQDVPIYVSEQSMPKGWVEVASWNMRAMRGKQRDEKLFVQEKFADQVRDEIAQYPDNTDGPKFQLTEDIENYQPRDVSWERAMLDRLMETAGRNREAVDKCRDALRTLNSQAGALRRAMSKQREYDRWTVDDLVSMAKSMLKSGLYKGMSPYEVQRLVGMINQGAGREDITRQANAVFDLMMKHHVKEWENQFNKLLRIRENKIDKNGVRVQGALDPKGQRMVKALREGITMSEKALEDRIWDCRDRMGSDDPVVAGNAADEYEGLIHAQQHYDNIGRLNEALEELRHERRTQLERVYEYWREERVDDYGNVIYRQDGEPSTVEKRRVRPEFGGVDESGNRMPVSEENKAIRKQVDATVARIEQAMRETEVNLADAYRSLCDNVGGSVAGSITRAKEWVESEKDRVSEIQHAANSDLLNTEEKLSGMDRSKEKGIANNAVVRFINSPLGSFEKFMRYFGQRSAYGEGRLFNKFMRGHSDCTDAEWRAYKEGLDAMNAKAEELFGCSWEKLMVKMRGGAFANTKGKLGIGREYPPIEVSYWVDGKRIDDTLNQDEVAYLIACSKMTDGMMKLENMGIDENMIAQLRQQVDPKMLQLADWYQHEFLPKQRTRINEVYKRMFGADMAHIDNYIHLNINERGLVENKDINQRMAASETPSTITGSLKERKRNTKPIDLHTSLLDLAMEEHQKMENWIAWAEYNRDLKDLLNYKKFKNKVYNMKSVELGSGEQLWDKFSKAVAVVTGDFQGGGKHSEMDRFATNAAKFVSSGCINFRVHTALKQVLSFPAFMSDARPGDILFAAGNAMGSVQWAMENLPGFSKRWESRRVGDTRLMDTDSDYSFWRNRWVQKVNKAGMTANASVDCLTVAIGARAVYETAKRRYLSYGYNEEQAERKALQDAYVSYNSSQQSSEGAFVSPMQVERTFLSAIGTTFRNASMGYQRRVTTGARNIARMLKKGYKEDMIENTKKQMMEEGLSEEQAQRAAERVYNRQLWHSMMDVANFGYALPFLWILGPTLSYLIAGDDDKIKKDTLSDLARHAMFGSIEGLTFGGVMSELGNMVLNNRIQGKEWKDLWNELKNKDLTPLPLVSRMQGLFDSFGKGWWEGINDFTGLLIQSGIGVDPNTITDVGVAILDACNGDLDTSKEVALGLMRILQFPQSQIDNLYIDELGLNGKDLGKYSYEELARRYARYKTNRDVLPTAMRSDEANDAAEEKVMKRFEAKVQERLDAMDADQLGQVFDSGDPDLKKIIGAKVAKDAGLKNERYSKKPDADAKPETAKATEAYQNKRNWGDISEDILLQQAKAGATADGDDERAKKIEKALSAITKLRNGDPEKGIKGMGVDKKTDERILKEIRETRSKALKELKISR